MATGNLMNPSVWLNVEQEEEKLMDCKCVEKWWEMWMSDGGTHELKTQNLQQSLYFIIFLYGSTHFMPFHTISCKKVYELMSLKAWIQSLWPSCYTSHGSLYLRQQRRWPWEVIAGISWWFCITKLESLQNGGIIVCGSISYYLEYPRVIVVIWSILWLS